MNVHTGRCPVGRARGHAPPGMSGARPETWDALGRVAGARPCSQQCRVVPFSLEPETMAEPGCSGFQKSVLERPAVPAPWSRGSSRRWSQRTEVELENRRVMSCLVGTRRAGLRKSSSGVLGRRKQSALWSQPAS